MRCYANMAIIVLLIIAYSVESFGILLIYSVEKIDLTSFGCLDFF